MVHFQRCQELTCVYTELTVWYRVDVVVAGASTIVRVYEKAWSAIDESRIRFILAIVWRANTLVSTELIVS
jgi:hypothetical protein